MNWGSSPFLFPFLFFPFFFLFPFFPFFFHFHAPRALSEEIMALFKVTDQILEKLLKVLLL
jgi:hypothetical protein